MPHSTLLLSTPLSAFDAPSRALSQSRGPGGLIEGASELPPTGEFDRATRVTVGTGLGPNPDQIDRAVDNERCQTHGAHHSTTREEGHDGAYELPGSTGVST